MTQTQKKLAFILQELVSLAKEKDIDVRIEKLVREVGYHVHSGRCRLGQKEVIILDRDLPVKEQVDFLAAEIRRSAPDLTTIPPHLRDFL